MAPHTMAAHYQPSMMDQYYGEEAYNGYYEEDSRGNYGYNYNEEAYFNDHSNYMEGYLQYAPECPAPEPQPQMPERMPVQSPGHFSPYDMTPVVQDNASYCDELATFCTAVKASLTTVDKKDNESTHSTHNNGSNNGNNSSSEGKDDTASIQKQMENDPQMLMAAPEGAPKKRKSRRRRKHVVQPDPRCDPAYWTNAPCAFECTIVPVDLDPLPLALIASM